MQAFRWLEFVDIAIPFALLGGMARRPKGRVVTLLLGAVLGLALLLPALSSNIPLRWAFVLAPMVTGLALGLALSPHETFLRLQTVLSFLAALLNFIAALERLAEQTAVVVNTPGLYVRYGEDWSFTFALLAVAAVPLGATISGLVARSVVEKAPPQAR